MGSLRTITKNCVVGVFSFGTATLPQFGCQKPEAEIGPVGPNLVNPSHSDIAKWPQKFNGLWTATSGIVRVGDLVDSTIILDGRERRVTLIELAFTSDIWPARQAPLNFRVVFKDGAKVEDDLTSSRYSEWKMMDRHFVRGGGIFHCDKFGELRFSDFGMRRVFNDEQFDRDRPMDLDCVRDQTMRSLAVRDR